MHKYMQVQVKRKHQIQEKYDFWLRVFDRGMVLEPTVEKVVVEKNTHYAADLKAFVNETGQIE